MADFRKAWFGRQEDGLSGQFIQMCPPLMNKQEEGKARVKIKMGKQEKKETKIIYATFQPHIKFENILEITI